MFKKCCVALATAVGVLGAAASQAAIVSLALSGNLTATDTFSGILRWDTGATATISQPSFSTFNAESLSLSINGVDQSGSIQPPPVIALRQYDGSSYFEDNFEVRVDIANGTGPLNDAYELLLDLRGIVDQSSMFSSVSTLPSNLDFLNGIDTAKLTVYYNTNGSFQTAQSLVLGAPVVPPPPSAAPEPGSLLLVAGAGLALWATRRRPAA